MADKPRTILKINTSGLAQQNSDSASAAPKSTASGTPKLKLTSKARPIPATSQEPQSASTPKTTIKLKFPTKPKPNATSSGKKREHKEVEDDQSAPINPGKKKLKLSFGKKPTDEPQSATVTTPYVRFKVNDKFKKKKKLRQKGYAYDSEASDREDEPVQQWNFILRMPPGDDADWLRTVTEKRELEQNKKHLRLRFLQEDGRRAMLTVRGRTYAAVLVDLPCIIESMKGWDKKGWYKSADIHQMLLILGQVNSEDEALIYPLPKAELDEKTWAYAHGLTPPMHWVRKRRFRKRISTHAIQGIEESVKKLLEKDAASIGDVQYDVLDREALRRQEDREREYEDDEEDEEAQFDEYFEQDDSGDDQGFQGQEGEEVDEDAFEAQFESFLGGGEDSNEAAETPGSSAAAAFETQNGTESDMGTPAAIGSKATSDDEDDDDDDEDDEDESEKEERAGFQRAREEIDELEAAIKEQLAEMERVGNPLLKTRIRNKIQALQADLELKKAAVGDEDDD